MGLGVDVGGGIRTCVVGVLLSSVERTSRVALLRDGGLRLFRTALTASSKFSSPPSGLLVRAPLLTSSRKAVFCL